MARTPHGALKVPRAFGVLVSHLPSAILSLPAFVSRSPPDNSCMYPSWISRSLCSAGIVRCIKPLAQSRNETNSSWVNGADKSGFIFQICASGAAVQASHPATINSDCTHSHRHQARGVVQRSAQFSRQHRAARVGLPVTLPSPANGLLSHAPMLASFLRSMA